MDDVLKLNELLEAEGWEDELDFAEHAIMDSVCPGICMNPDCDYTTEVEPDCDDGYCEVCGTNTVRSGLSLMGIV